MKDDIEYVKEADFFLKLEEMREWFMENDLEFRSISDADHCGRSGGLCHGRR